MRQTTTALVIDTDPALPALLYLHGFLSSPQSNKAQQTVRYCRAMGFNRLLVPEMVTSPAATMAQLEALIAKQQDSDLVLIGSSLGGYYATYLGERYGFPAALINPAVRPFEHWEEHIGRHKNYYNDTIQEVTYKDIEELEALHVDRLSKPENFLLLVETGDETLDYRLAVEKYADATKIVHKGGNHSYEHFSEDLPHIFDFLLSRIA